MLINAINDCIASINEVSKLRENKLGLDAFESAVRKLSDVEATVNLFVSTSEAMHQYDFCKVIFTDDELQSFQHSIAECGRTVNQLELSANDVKALSSIFSTQYERLVFTWQNEAKKYVVPIQSYLNVIQFLLDNKEEAASLSRSLATGSAAEPTAAIVHTLAANAQKANALTSNFQMSDSVRIFLNKTKSRSATLADITPEVRDWITEHKLDRKIKLSF